MASRDTYRSPTAARQKTPPTSPVITTIIRATTRRGTGLRRPLSVVLVQSHPYGSITTVHV